MIVKEIMKNNFITIDQNKVISKLIGKFKTSKKHNAIILDGKNYAGIVCKRKLLNAKLRVEEEKIKKILMRPAVLNGDESLEKVASLMNSSDVHILPVVKNKKVTGVVYAIDILKNLLPLIGEKKVSEISKQKCTSFDQHTKINEAMKIMRFKKIDRAPIVNAKHKLMGIISTVDLFLKFSMFPGNRKGGSNISQSLSSPGKEKEASSIYVIHEATVDVVTATMKDRLKIVVKLMSDNKISDVVIVDDSYAPIGIVTIKDILKLF